MIEITLTCAGEAPRTVRFETPRIRIGRGDDNDLVVKSQGCSRHHAEIVREGGGYKILDLGSTNGVIHDARPVAELEIGQGTEVLIGQHRLRFSLPGGKDDDRTVRIDYQRMESLVAEAAKTAAPPQLYLVWGSGDAERSLKLIAGAEYVLGRSPSADVRLDDRECSVQHAMVAMREGRFAVRDLDSSNGTFVNGERIRESVLAIDDEIRLGKTVLRVTDHVFDLVDKGQLLERTRMRRLPEPRPEPEDAPLAPERQAGGPSEDRGRRPPPSPRELGAAYPPPRTGKRKWGLALAAAAVVAVALGAFLLGGRVRGPAGPGPVAAPAEGSAGETLVQVAEVAREKLVFDVSGSGSARARRTATVSAEVAARVEEVTAAEGTGVAQGALLVRLNDRDIQHQIDAASASISREQVDLAKTDYERKKRLFEDGALVRSAYEQAKNNYLTVDSAYRSTQAKISQLRELLAKTRILAPIDGVVVETFVNPGEFVAPGAPVVALENLDEVLVQVDLADRDFVGVHLGQAVEATTDAFPGRVFRGEVFRLGTAANPVTRTFEVEARLLNPDHSLRTGMIVFLRIIQGEEEGLVVPTEALVDDAGEQAAVFVVRGGVAQRLEVRLGRRLDRDVQVLEGLSEGDEVVVNGQDRLRDQQAVRTYRKGSRAP